MDIVDIGWLTGARSGYGVRFLGFGERGFLVLRFVGYVGLVVVGVRRFVVCCTVPCCALLLAQFNGIKIGPTGKCKM